MQVLAFRIAIFFMFQLLGFKVRFRVQCRVCSLEFVRVYVLWFRIQYLFLGFWLSVYVLVFRVLDFRFRIGQVSLFCFQCLKLGFRVQGGTLSFPKVNPNVFQMLIIMFSQRGTLELSQGWILMFSKRKIQKNQDTGLRTEGSSSSLRGKSKVRVHSSSFRASVVRVQSSCLSVSEIMVQVQGLCLMFRGTLMLGQRRTLMVSQRETLILSERWTLYVQPRGMLMFR